jgi:hypothetical protein
MLVFAGCPATSHPTFPPPEGYDSWEEYENRNQNPATLSETIPPETHEPEPDTTPPVISDVDISNITESSATIEWKTDEKAICQIEYGEGSTWDEIEDLDSDFKTSHSVTLTDLEAENTYYFIIQASDDSENEALSEEYDFTTKTTEGCISLILYAGMIIGGRVHQLSFSLFNGSSQAITVTKVEVFDEHDDVTFTMSKSDISDTWGDGEVDSGKSVSASISFGIQPSTSEVEDWQVKWYCSDAQGDKFTVKEQYSSH